MRKGYLILEDGRFWEGRFWGSRPRIGEVVFNTSHSGYQEIVTDPSYLHQIMVFTAPQIGNYGVRPEYTESTRPQVSGVIALDISEPLHLTSLHSYLQMYEVPRLTDLDTRDLVLHIREKGTPWGVILPADNIQEARREAEICFRAREKIPLNWPSLVTTRKSYSLAGQKGDGPSIGVIDFGVKQSILKQLQRYASQITVYPCSLGVEEIRDLHHDVWVLSNGPGDPSAVESAPLVIQELIDHFPILAICMGHQLLSRALGGATYKLPFGHRGGNHPIRDDWQKKIYVASHNHGYAVRRETLPEGIPFWLTNLNDQSLAGFVWPERKIMSIQFHPEAGPGPWDAYQLFDSFFRDLVR